MDKLQSINYRPSYLWKGQQAIKKLRELRELSLTIMGRGWKRSCRGLKFFPANLLGSETIDGHLVGVSN